MALEFSAPAKQQIERLRSRYPTRQAALLPVLHIAQDEFGYLSDEAIDLVAATLSLAPAHVYGVVTFYTMFHREPRGTNELMVCTNVSCMLRGGYEILGHIEKRLGIKKGESTSDGAFSLVEEECLAACANAPMMICGPEYYLDLTPEKVDKILDDLKKRYLERRKNQAPGNPGSSGTGGVGTGTGSRPAASLSGSPAKSKPQS
jgi:NADH-quinone oxidoreductase E subunit